MLCARSLAGHSYSSPAPTLSFLSSLGREFATNRMRRTPPGGLRRSDPARIPVGSEGCILVPRTSEGVGETYIIHGAEAMELRAGTCE
jgi:hypothetical protein